MGTTCFAFKVLGAFASIILWGELDVRWRLEDGKKRGAALLNNMERTRRKKNILTSFIKRWTELQSCQSRYERKEDTEEHRSGGGTPERRDSLESARVFCPGVQEKTSGRGRRKTGK